MTVFGRGQHGQALRSQELGRLQRAPRYRPSLAGPYRDHLRKRRAKQPAVPVQQLLREIRELGYQGSSNLLVRYLNQGRVEGNRPHLSPAGQHGSGSLGPPASRRSALASLVRSFAAPPTRTRATLAPWRS